MQQLLQIATVHYPIHEKLIKLINSIGYQWAENIELKKEIQKVSTNSSTCKIFKKLPKTRYWLAYDNQLPGNYWNRP